MGRRPGGRRPPGRRPAGRRPGPSETRAQILAAARTAFGERGYDGATMRGIAALAGVDAHLVHHYFGTKQRLFVAAMELPAEALAGLPRVIAGAPEHLGERVIRFMLDLWESPAVQPLILGMVRSATSDPVAAGMLRRLIAEGPVLVVARALDRPDAALRATLAGSQFVGLTMVRSIIGVEPLASADREFIVRAMAPAIQRYLTADLGSADQPVRRVEGSGEMRDRAGPRQT